MLRDIDKTSCQIAGVCCTECRIGKTFSCAVGGHEVLQNVQTFTEVGFDRQLDRTSGRICHQSTHPCKLFDLFIGTTGSGICHHEDVVILIQAIQQRLGQFSVGLSPGLDDFLITLFFCDQTTAILLCDLVHSLLRFLDQFRFLRRHGHIRNGHGHCSLRRILISHCLHIIQHFCRLCGAVDIHNAFQDLFQMLLCNMEINLRKQFVFFDGTINESQILRNDLIKEHSAERCLDHGEFCFAILVFFAHADMNFCMKRKHTVLIRQDRLINIPEILSFTLGSVTFLGQIVNTKNHIL